MFIDFRLAQALRETDKKNQELLKNVPTQALRKSVAPPPVESKVDLKTSGGKKGPVGVTQVPKIVVTQSCCSRTSPSEVPLSWLATRFPPV